GISYQWKKGNTSISGATDISFTTSQTGSYKVKETNDVGCSSTSAPSTISNYPVPNATITPQGSLDICLTGSVVLKANNNPGGTYKWFKNNAAISGATNKSYTATTVGDYKVKVTNSNGCSKTSTPVTVFTSCKFSSDNFTSSAGVNLYPNPSNGKFT